ncbi:hypothetical protein OH76DRAFT_1199505 [Lentinus brumalis]|uniref:SWIM-type domain-containing protein n=1 Tax=Lentinus brumalis TaxID=2498619 RepID=A0A371CT33_9APHY|nr:hypothetical protein OH76DRAFT_1199505 [Polyporus brumalis]
MAQEPLRRVSRLKKVKDTEHVVPVRQASRLLGAQRATSARRDTSSGAARTRVGGATGGSATSGAGRDLGRSSSTSLAHSLPAPPSSQPAIDLPFLDGDHAPVPSAAEVANGTQDPVPLSDMQQDAITDYWYALTHVGGVFRLEKRHFVFQDWDSKAETLKLGSYVHVVRLPHGPDSYGTTCTCPRFKATAACFHQHLLILHVHDLEVLPIIAPDPIPPAVYIVTTPFNDVYIYSCVSSTGRFESGKRVIVSFQRNRRWHCDSCGYATSCKHIPHAVEHARLAGFVENRGEDDSVHARDDDIEGQLLLTVGGRDERKHGCISYQRIPVPRWCALPHENTQSVRPPSPPPSLFMLDAVSRCCCGTLLQSVQGTYTPVMQAALLFDLTRGYIVAIQVVPCPNCNHRRRFVGADLGTIGILNWNNNFLFTHDLMNAYTNNFTASETPFSAFCTTVRRSYEDHPDSRGHTVQFCSDETFVRAWFAFIKLQDLGGTMRCPTCGPSPRVVIADGVSLATHASKLTSSVRPPTFTNTSSERI